MTDGTRNIAICAIVIVAVAAIAAAVFLTQSSDDDGKIELRYSYDSLGMEAELIQVTGKPIAIDIPGEVTKDGQKYTVTGIDGMAFERCKNLESVSIPKSVSSIDSGAFKECTSLRSITVEDDCGYYYSENGVLFDAAGTKLIAYPAGSIETSYKIPDGTICIVEYAFNGSKNLASIELNEDLILIADGSFNGCTSLKTLTNRTVLNIVKGSDDYGGVAKYADKVDGRIVSYTDEDGSVYSLNLDSGIAQLISYGGDETAVQLEPDIVYQGKDYELRSIGTKAFAETDVTDMYLPYTVSSVMETAFQGCSGLVRFNAGDNLMYIGRLAFDGCTELSVIDMDVGTACIEAKAFEDSKKVTYLCFSHNLLYVGPDAFSQLTFMDGDLEVEPTARNLSGSIWKGTGDGILRFR